MNIVWDEPKRRANLDKHGMDFADLSETFFNHALILATRGSRWRAIGIAIHGVVAVIFATRGTEGVSIISLRPASKKERRLYEESRR